MKVDLYVLFFLFAADSVTLTMALKWMEQNTS